MAKGRNRQQWGHTSMILAMLANVNRDTKKRASPFKPEDFNPYAEKKKPTRRAKVPISVLRDVFINQKPLDAVIRDLGQNYTDN